MFTFQKSLSVLLNSKKGCRRFLREVKRGNIDSNLYLQDHYQDLDINHNTIWPVCLALAEYCKEEELKALFDAATIKPDRELLTRCLQTACVHGNIKVISYLIKVGAKVNEWVLESTILNCNHRILKILLNHPDVNKIKHINRKLTKWSNAAKEMYTFEDYDINNRGEIRNSNRTRSLISRRIQLYIWL